MATELGTVGFQAAVDLATNVIDTLLKGAAKKKETKK